MALNVKRVRGLKRPGRYLDGNGLYLQVMSNSNRSWLLRFERQGRERWMGLGSAELFSLQEARERAREARRLLADGIDPIDSRRTERAQRADEAAKRKDFETVALEISTPTNKAGPLSTAPMFADHSRVMLFPS